MPSSRRAPPRPSAFICGSVGIVTVRGSDRSPFSLPYPPLQPGPRLLASPFPPQFMAGEQVRKERGSLHGPGRRSNATRPRPQPRDSPPATHATIRPGVRGRGRGPRRRWQPLPGVPRATNTLSLYASRSILRGAVSPRFALSSPWCPGTLRPRSQDDCRSGTRRGTMCLPGRTVEEAQRPDGNP